MDKKKTEEKLILEAFNNCVNSEFQILTSEEAQKIFPEYTGENPDFIIYKNTEYIGVDLFMLSLNQSNPPIEYSGKTYRNQMHKQSQHPNIFTAIEETEKYLQEIKNNPKSHSLTKQDDLAIILKERLTQKMQVLKNYVTDRNWLIGHATETFNTGIVENITEGNIVASVKELMNEILNAFPVERSKLENIFLFEHSTGSQSYIFAYK